MQVQNPTRISRLCYGLGQNIEAFEVHDVADGFVKCDGCQCILSGVEATEPEPTPDAEPVEAAE